MAFSWAKAKERAIVDRIEYEMILARGGNTDFKTKHPNEVRDAVKKDYVLLIKRVKEEMTKTQNSAMIRRTKVRG